MYVKRTFIVIAVVTVVVAAVIAARLATRAWVRSLGMGMAELLSDGAFRVLCERKNDAQPGSAVLLSLCARLHCAVVQRGLMSVPDKHRLIGYALDDRRRRVAAALRRADGCSVLVFRCAVRVDEIGVFFDVRREPVAMGGHAHRGLSRAYQRLSSDVNRLLSGTGDDLVITGYSMGGALAIMAAIELSWTKSIDLHVFAAPACVDHQCASALDKVCRVTTSLVNTADLITRPVGSFVHIAPCHFHSAGHNAHAYGAYMKGLFTE